MRCFVAKVTVEVEGDYVHPKERCQITVVSGERVYKAECGRAIVKVRAEEE